MEKNNIAVTPEKCTECISCQLICSMTYTGAFNPEEARIIVNPPQSIHFTDECKEECILCTRYCKFDAITRVKEE